MQQLPYLWKLKIKTKDLIKNILKCGNTEVLTVKCKYKNNVTQNRTVITQETSTCKYLYCIKKTSHVLTFLYNNLTSMSLVLTQMCGHVIQARNVSQEITVKTHYSHTSRK